MGAQWDEVLASVRMQMTAAMYETVFAHCRVLRFSGDELEIGFANEHSRAWAEQRLAGIVQRSVCEVYGRAVTVRFVLDAVRISERSEVAEHSGAANGAATQVEDRRQRFYIIDNIVLDAYLPLMGLKAYAVYSLYSRMAREDLAWPGFDYICKALHIGRSTLSECNRTLEALGLIEVARGDSERSNRYYLLQVQSLGPERVQECRQRAHDLGLSKLAEALGVVLNGDHPSPEWGPPQSSTGTTPVPNGDYPSPERGLEQNTLNKTQEQNTGTRAELTDSELADLLVSLGMARVVALKLILQYDRRAILQCAEYARGQPGLKNPAGFVVKRIRDGTELPSPAGDGETREG